MIDAASVAERNTALLEWYRSTGRTLPWRDQPDPYVTMVSEAMLQQTQVDRVIPRFTSFMDAYPDVGALAAADTRELLAIWSGLGYNTRALRLRDAARQIVASGWPTSAVALQSLPGVGPYTAAAIASIAMGEDVPAVDTNVRRVVSRWVGEPLSGRHLDEVANEVVASPAGDWNQAVMDLGATVCRPTNPRCNACPVEAWCTDHEVYEPPPRQATFEGSRRQLRGAIVRAHIAGTDLIEAGKAIGRDPSEVASVVEDLTNEGLIGGE